MLVNSDCFSRETNSPTDQLLKGGVGDHFGDCFGERAAKAGQLSDRIATANPSLPSLTISASDTLQAKPEPQHKSYLTTWIDSGTAKIISDPKTRESVDRLILDFVKTASYYVGGKVGMASPFVIGGLSQARPDDGWKEQAADFALGGLKGMAMKRIYKNLIPADMSVVLKGALTGISIGTVNEVCKQQTFTQPSSLIERLKKSTLNPEAIALSIGARIVSVGIQSAAKSSFQSALENNQMLSRMVIRGSYGLAMGMVNEIKNEKAQKIPLEPGKILWEGLAHGAATAAGVAAGIELGDSLRNLMN